MLDFHSICMRCSVRVYRFCCRASIAPSREFLPKPFQACFDRILQLGSGHNIVRIKVCERESQKFMLVPPLDLAFGELLAIRWRRRRIRNLSDQVCCRCLRNAVDQNTQKRNLQENVKADAEAEEKAFTVVEPGFLLGWSEAHAGEIGFQLEKRSVAFFERIYVGRWWITSSRIRLREEK